MVEVQSTVVATLRALGRLLRDRRVQIMLVLVAVLAVIAVTTPHPTAVQIRDWAQGAGSALPLVFLAVYVVATLFPIPRTVFTLSAGLLFGAVAGIAIALVATTISAVLALLGVRLIGRDYVWERVSHPAARRIDEHLARRGALAVISIRMIAFVPFSIANYVAGVSGIRLLPYTIGTIIGVAPGTVGVVLLGDAVTGTSDPRLLLVSAVCMAVGLLGLAFDLRRLRAEPAPVAP